MKKIFLYGNDNLTSLKDDINLLENVYHLLSGTKNNDFYNKSDNTFTKISKSDIDWDKINIYRKKLHANLICLQKQKHNTITVGYYFNNKSLCYASLFYKEYRDGLEVQNLCLSPTLFFLSLTEEIKNYKKILLKQVAEFAKQKNKNFIYIIGSNEFYDTFENARIESVYKKVMSSAQVMFIYRKTKYPLKIEDSVEISWLIQDIKIIEDIISKRISPLNICILSNSLNQIYDIRYTSNLIKIIFRFIDYISNDNNKTVKLIKELEKYIINIRYMIRHIILGKKINVFYHNNVILGYLCFDIKGGIINVCKIIESSWLFIVNLIKSLCHYDLYRLVISRVMKIAIQSDKTLKVKFNFFNKSHNK